MDKSITFNVKCYRIWGAIKNFFYDQFVYIYFFKQVFDIWNPKYICSHDMQCTRREQTCYCSSIKVLINA